MTATQGRQEQGDAGEAEARRTLRYKAGAVDEVVESSSTLGEGQRHNDLLKLSSYETDATQQVVRHSSALFLTSGNK